MLINMLKVYEIMGLGFLESNDTKIGLALGDRLFLAFMKTLTIICP